VTRRWLLTSTSLLLVSVTAACMIANPRGGKRADDRLGKASTDGGWISVGRYASGAGAAAAGLTHVAGPAGRGRVADGLAPPTNRWYSGALFGDTAQPVFASPLAVLAKDDAVTLDLPQTTASANTVAGPFIPQLRLGLPADDFQATADGPVSVTITYRRGSTAVGRLTLAEGWPYAGYTAVRAQHVALPDGLRPRSDGRWASVTPVGSGTTYGLVAVDERGRHQRLSVSGGRVALAPGESVVAFGAPDGAVAARMASRAAVLQTVLTAYAVNGGSVRTQLRYRTLGKAVTLVAARPDQQLVGAAARAHTVGRIPSIYGSLRLLDTSTLTTGVRRVSPRGALDLGSLGPRARTALAAQVRKDTAAAEHGPALPTDSYFGGKALYRLAQLERLARSLGLSDAESRLHRLLVAGLDAWLDSATCAASDTRCFSYDPRLRGVVGREPSFDSDQFNDHHFHYGYFLAAASLVAGGNPALVRRWSGTLTALAEDIASPTSSRSVPALRVFDPYAGHSWASGLAPFADGNNQESSSEAVNAWNGLALWARASGRRNLLLQATWQLSVEMDAARHQWLEPTYLPTAYRHDLVALNWGGKRDYATWFSAAPSAMLGIQLIPMSPVQAALDIPAERIRRQVTAATRAGAESSPLTDYVVMYMALADPQRALAEGRVLQAAAIDEGDSRSYLLAWLLRYADEGRH
jgi:endo-1,3(4)-beta-glucanase